jgi:hypothetical protein
MESAPSPNSAPTKSPATRGRAPTLFKGLLFHGRAVTAALSLAGLVFGWFETLAPAVDWIVVSWSQATAFAFSWIPIKLPALNRDLVLISALLVSVPIIGESMSKFGKAHTALDKYIEISLGLALIIYAFIARPSMSPIALCLAVLFIFWVSVDYWPVAYPIYVYLSVIFILELAFRFVYCPYRANFLNDLGPACKAAGFQL